VIENPPQADFDGCTRIYLYFFQSNNGYNYILAKKFLRQIRKEKTYAKTL